MLRFLRGFLKAKDGLAAIEFAFIAPVLGALLMGTIELCAALQCHQKVTMVASSASDLVAQTTTTSPSSMQDVFAAATAIVYPFPSANITIIVSSILSDGKGGGTVAWSIANAGSGLSKNSKVTLGQPMMMVSSTDHTTLIPCPVNQCSLILTQVRYNYTSGYGHFLVGPVSMADSFYERPRKSATVTCTGCSNS